MAKKIKENWIPPRNIELSPWKTPLGIGHAKVQELDPELYYDKDDLEQLKEERRIKKSK